MLTIFEFNHLYEVMCSYKDHKLCIGMSGKYVGKVFLRGPIVRSLDEAEVMAPSGVVNSVPNFHNYFLEIMCPDDFRLKIFEGNLEYYDLRGIVFKNAKVSCLFEVYILLPLYLIEYLDADLLLPYSKEVLGILRELFNYSVKDFASDEYFMTKITYIFGYKLDKIISKCLKVHKIFDRPKTNDNSINDSKIFNKTKEVF